MLRGNYRATVDPKGRLKIPADFLAALAEYGNEFYVTSENGDYAQIYPMKVWAENEERLARLSSHNRTKRKFLDVTNYYGQVVKIDGQGRVLIPPVLRDSAQMQGEVDVMGKLTYLEVWNHTRFMEWMRANPITPDDEKTLDELGI
jgi:transcriptional regulator MraZ